MSIKKTTARINLHVLIHQHEFMKALSKKDKKGQGELLREIIQFYIDNKK